MCSGFYVSFFICGCFLFFFNYGGWYLLATKCVFDGCKLVFMLDFAKLAPQQELYGNGMMNSLFRLIHGCLFSVKFACYMD